MLYCELTLELTETIEADVCVFFACTHPGYKATYYDPPEPPEFEFEEVEVCELYGATYDKTGPEIADAGWYDIVVQKAKEALDAYDELYDHMIDAYLSDDGGCY